MYLILACLATVSVARTMFLCVELSNGSDKWIEKEPKELRKSIKNLRIIGISA
jgi:hypothetical protein